MIKIQEIDIDTENVVPKRKLSKDLYNLSVFTYPWSWKTWHGFWKNIGCFFDNIKKMFQRARKGYCYSDTYDCGDTIIDYLIVMLTDFRNRTNNYPAEDFASYEEWVAYLDKIIDDLEYAGTHPDNLSKWRPIWCELLKEGQRNYELEDRIFHLYHEEIVAISAEQQKRLEEAMVRLSLYIKDIWW